MIRERRSALRRRSCPLVLALACLSSGCTHPMSSKSATIDADAEKAEAMGGGDAGSVADADRGGLPFSPTEGCRDNSSAGCSQCCAQSVDDNGAQTCDISQSYASMSGPGPCPSGCPTCARCSTLTESSLSDKAKSSRSDCDCPTVDPGIDPCYAPSSCGCFCSSLMAGLAACPQVGETVCGHGNHCGAIVTSSSGPYRGGEKVTAVWTNYDTRPAVLGSCGALSLLRQEGLSQGTILEAPSCAPTDVGVVLQFGQSWTYVMTLPTGSYGSQFWLHGTYYLGCTGGSGVAPEGCTAGPIDSYQSIQIAP